MCKTENCQGYLVAGQYQYDYCSTCRTEAFYHGILPQPVQEFILSLLDELKEDTYEQIRCAIERY